MIVEEQTKKKKVLHVAIHSFETRISHRSLFLIPLLVPGTRKYIQGDTENVGTNPFFTLSLI